MRAMMKVSENSSPIASDIPGRFRSAFTRIIHALWQRVAAEHRCYPPDDGHEWVAAPTAADTAGRYVCPECEQHFVAVRRKK
jgi:hypothetical protein